MMAQVASFITTLEGTTPASPKAPEGKQVNTNATASVDTTANDTARITIAK
jgi:hypothetical protein